MKVSTSLAAPATASRTNQGVVEDVNVRYARVVSAPGEGRGGRGHGCGDEGREGRNLEGEHA